MDPISTGQLTRDEIEKGENDPDYRLKLGESKVTLPPQSKKKGPRYTPVSRRHERPSAILWLVRNHPELKDAQIMRLVGTTKTTIASVRDRTHWNASTLTPMDPVTLGLCSQIELDFEVQRAAKEKPMEPLMAAPPCCRPPRPPARSRNRAREKSATTSMSTRCRQAEDHRRQEAGRRRIAGGPLSVALPLHQRSSSPRKRGSSTPCPLGKRIGIRHLLLANAVTKMMVLALAAANQLDSAYKFSFHGNPVIARRYFSPSTMDKTG